MIYLEIIDRLYCLGWICLIDRSCIVPQQCQLDMQVQNIVGRLSHRIRTSKCPIIGREVIATLWLTPSRWTLSRWWLSRHDSINISLDLIKRRPRPYLRRSDLLGYHLTLQNILCRGVKDTTLVVVLIINTLLWLKQTHRISCLSIIWWSNRDIISQKREIVVELIYPDILVTHTQCPIIQGYFEKMFEKIVIRKRKTYIIQSISLVRSSRTIQSLYRFSPYRQCPQQSLFSMTSPDIYPIKSGLVIISSRHDRTSPILDLSPPISIEIDSITKFISLRCSYHTVKNFFSRSTHNSFSIHFFLWFIVSMSIVHLIRQWRIIRRHFKKSRNTLISLCITHPWWEHPCSYNRSYKANNIFFHTKKHKEQNKIYWQLTCLTPWLQETDDYDRIYFFYSHHIPMPKIEKKLNKRLIWLVLGATAIWVWTAASMTPQGKSFWKRVKEFLSKGRKALKKDFKKDFS